MELDAPFGDTGPKLKNEGLVQVAEESDGGCPAEGLLTLANSAMKVVRLRGIWKGPVSAETPPTIGKSTSPRPRPLTVRS